MARPSIPWDAAIEICRKAKQHGADALCPYTPYSPRWYVWKTRLKYKGSHEFVLNGLIKYGLVEDDRRK